MADVFAGFIRVSISSIGSQRVLQRGVLSYKSVAVLRVCFRPVKKFGSVGLGAAGENCASFQLPLLVVLAVCRVVSRKPEALIDLEKILNPTRPNPKV